ncbi:uncharacterized protein EV420DRAFT_1744704 [Desarmillaria tabescens]|uniref:Zn(2)-C6 fungal-type domain-containing protein n=1 Tax=Armillaria tabescens TaxID=1929756 RepID=A0AA39T4K6_ARMTA|nr:uncharacterized protein EV420DRAFT_1744704 [Desarmillaria tabescens]KAK0464276.1 hypothetical protein EV420DRAFT_1744704 [Desarmillaria tabescens]
MDGKDRGDNSGKRSSLPSSLIPHLYTSPQKARNSSTRTTLPEAGDDEDMESEHPGPSPPPLSHRSATTPLSSGSYPSNVPRTVHAFGSYEAGWQGDPSAPPGLSGSSSIPHGPPSRRADEGQDTVAARRGTPTSFAVRAGAPPVSSVAYPADVHRPYAGYETAVWQESPAGSPAPARPSGSSSVSHGQPIRSDPAYYVSSSRGPSGGYTLQHSPDYAPWREGEAGPSHAHYDARGGMRQRYAPEPQPSPSRGMGHYEQVYRRDSVPRSEPPVPSHGMSQYDERAAVGYRREPIPRDTYMGGGPPVTHYSPYSVRPQYQEISPSHGIRAGPENLYSEVLPPRQVPAYILPPIAAPSGLSEEVSSSGTDDDGDGEYTPTKSRRGKKRVRSTSPGGDDSRRKSVKKTLIACDFCRGRKLRCDGARPSCMNCTARDNRPCVYQSTPKRRGPGKNPKPKTPKTKKRSSTRARTSESVRAEGPSSSVEDFDMASSASERQRASPSPEEVNQSDPSEVTATGPSLYLTDDNSMAPRGSQRNVRRGIVTPSPPGKRGKK